MSAETLPDLTGKSEVGQAGWSEVKSWSYCFVLPRFAFALENLEWHRSLVESRCVDDGASLRLNKVR